MRVPLPGPRPLLNPYWRVSRLYPPSPLNRQAKEAQYAHVLWFRHPLCRQGIHTFRLYPLQRHGLPVYTGNDGRRGRIRPAFFHCAQGCTDTATTLCHTFCLARLSPFPPLRLSVSPPLAAPFGCTAPGVPPLSPSPACLQFMACNLRQTVAWCAPVHIAGL